MCDLTAVACDGLHPGSITSAPAATPSRPGARRNRAWPRSATNPQKTSSAACIDGTSTHRRRFVRQIAAVATMQPNLRKKSPPIGISSQGLPPQQHGACLGATCRRSSGHDAAAMRCLVLLGLLIAAPLVSAQPADAGGCACARGCRMLCACSTMCAACSSDTHKSRAYCVLLPQKQQQQQQQQH
jgi:hypothetical protein